MSLIDWLSLATLALVFIGLAIDVRLRLQKRARPRFLGLRLAMLSVVINSTISLAHVDSPIIKIVGSCLALVLAVTGTITLFLQNRGSARAA
jgi:hypothetical protein